jgi:dUTP pyrophosphatase
MRVAKLHPSAIIPTRKHEGDAGFDLYAWNYKVVIPPLTARIIHTGITIEIPRNVVGKVEPKSGIPCLVLGGVIDNPYQGEILVNLFNTTQEDLVFEHGIQIAQILFFELYKGDAWNFEEVPKEIIHAEKSLRSATGGIHTVTTTPEIIGDGTLEYRGWD